MRSQHMKEDADVLRHFFYFLSVLLLEQCISSHPKITRVIDNFSHAKYVTKR